LLGLALLLVSLSFFLAGVSRGCLFFFLRGAAAGLGVPKSMSELSSIDTVCDLGAFIPVVGLDCDERAEEEDFWTA
jgi:hypothetical protein